MSEKFNGRQFTALVILIILASIVIYRLANLQVVNGDKYYKQSQAKLKISERIEAPRGDILDRFGRPLVSNEIGFSIQIKKNGNDNAKINKCVLNLIKIFDKCDGHYEDGLEISDYPYEYTFYEYEGKERDKKIKEFSYDEKTKKHLTAAQKMKQLSDKYELSKYPEEEKRKIAGVRYEMELRDFDSEGIYTFATDVDMNLISILKEQSRTFSDITISTRPVRKYIQNNFASHILGRVGIIYAEEYEKLKDSNYSINAIIGKDGIEKICEKYLKGTDGKTASEQTIESGGAYYTDEIPAKQGNNVILTINYDLQDAAEKALKETILSINGGGVGSKIASGGSVVALDVNSAEILAMASYPDYNIKTFDKDYEMLYRDPQKPMFNRAISGAYAPGSIFKILTSIAVLEDRIVTPETLVFDEGVYKIGDHSFNCLVYTQAHVTHGYINVSQALKDSCNYFYYKTGHELGIKRLDYYSKKFGLGQLTGVELEGEKPGVLASPEYKEKAFHEMWYPGDTVQFAIGQSFNLFTPLQLANYVATFANGGTRYKPHIIKSIKDRDTGKNLVSNESVVLNKIDISDRTYDAVLKGMRMVASNGTASSTFASFPIDVCCKTGSAQVVGSNATGTFVAVAPYDKPQIAIAIVVENAGSGAAVAPIARKILAKYFNIEDNFEPAKKSE